MSKIDDVSELLFSKFQKKFPLPNDKSQGRSPRPPSQQLIEQRLVEFCEEAYAVRKQYSLGVISWARVVKALQERLLLAGQAPEVVKPLLFSMILAAQKTK